jgi:hypothetical protein
LGAHDQVGIVGYAFELTHGGTRHRFKELHPAVFPRKVIRRRVGGFKHPKSTGRVTDHFSPVADDDVFATGL